MRIGTVCRAAALVLALLPAAAAGLEAQDRRGEARTPLPGDNVYRIANRGASFLELGVGARALALGGAYVAIAEGVSALYWNPAGVADLPGVAGAISYESLYENSGLTNTFFGIAAPIGTGAVGLSMIQFSSGEIERTTERYPEGNDPTAGGHVEWTATAMGLTYARQITDRLQVGVTGKFASEGINFARATYYGGDVGFRFRTGLYGLTIGTALVNIGNRARMEGNATNRDIPPTNEPFLPTQRTLPSEMRTTAVLMPAAFRFGVRSELIGGADALLQPSPEHSLVAVGEMVNQINAPVMPSFAFEYGFRELLFLRGSKLFRNGAEAESQFGEGLAAGFGVRIPGLGRRVALDYAYKTIELGSSQSVSIEFGF
jgi:hypothetical protein